MVTGAAAAITAAEVRGGARRPAATGRGEAKQGHGEGAGLTLIAEEDTVRPGRAGRRCRRPEAGKAGMPAEFLAVSGQFPSRGEREENGGAGGGLGCSGGGRSWAHGAAARRLGFRSREEFHRDREEEECGANEREEKEGTASSALIRAR